MRRKLTPRNQAGQGKKTRQGEEGFVKKFLERFCKGAGWGPGSEIKAGEPSQERIGKSRTQKNSVKT